MQGANQQPTPTLPVCYVVSGELLRLCGLFSLLARVCRYFALNSLSSNSLAFSTSSTMFRNISEGEYTSTIYGMIKEQKYSEAAAILQMEMPTIKNLLTETGG